MEITTGKSFKYDLEELDSTTDEFMFLKEFFDTTYGTDLINKTSVCSETYFQIMDNFHIYKVNENKPIKALNEKRNNIMLFHGTNWKSVIGILKEGFKNSKCGWFGKAVYMTDCSNTAKGYSTPLQPDDPDKCCMFMFVNEVLGSDKLEVFEYDRITNRNDVDTELTNPFEKHMCKLSRKLIEDNYKKDLLGRKYRNVVVDINSYKDEYVADESVTIPSYLIVFQNKWKRSWNTA